jgi:hypothetical protein
MVEAFVFGSAWAGVWAEAGNMQAAKAALTNKLLLKFFMVSSYRNRLLHACSSGLLTRQKHRGS